MTDLTKNTSENPDRIPEPSPIPVPPAYTLPVYNYIPMQAAVSIKKEKTVFTKTELVYSFAVFIMSFLLLRFSVCNPTGYVTTAVIVLFLTASLIFMKLRGVKGSPRTAVTAAVMYIFSALYPLTDNEFIKGLDTLFLALCFIWLMYQYGSTDRRIPRFLPLVMLRAAFEYPLSSFTKLPEAVSESVKRTRIGKNFGLILAGILVTFIPTLVIGGLLIKADNGVEKMLSGTSKFITSTEMIRILLQLAFSLPISFYIFGVMFSNARRDHEKDLTEESCLSRMRKVRVINSVIIVTALTPICVLYLLFFISQANYLLSAFLNRLPEGFSHSEYARRGFFELLAIIIINIVIIMAADHLSKPSDPESDTPPLALRIYTAVISFFTLVMIASALSKMIMYISEYGLSELRLYTGWFMVLSAFLFIFIMIKQFAPSFSIVRPFTAVFVVMFAILTFGRPDSIIASYNIGIYNAGLTKRLDVEYLYSLSDDSRAYCIKNGVYKDISLTIPPLDNTDISTIYVSNHADLITDKDSK